jgi:aminoglycoside/choline kinase family phosphotransferase
MYGTATKVRLNVTYGGASNASAPPPTLIVKGGFSAHRELMYREYMLEARFYSELAPRLDSIRVPRGLHATHDDSQRQAIVILEDLDAREATFCRVQKPLTYDQAAAQLDTLASLHAQWWKSGELAPGGPLAWVDALDPLPEGVLGTYQRSRLVPEVYAECMALPRGVAVSTYFHDRDRMERAMERLRHVDRLGPHCLLHTDPHLGNWYIDRDGRPGLLDWQSVRKGPWAHDVNYCLVSSVDMLDRRAWERALLLHYLDALQSRGVSPPSFENAWEAYRRQTVYGLYYWLVNPVEFQVEVNNCAVASRFAFAAIDHGTFELLA